jgi:hypothetical protein
VSEPSPDLRPWMSVRLREALDRLAAALSLADVEQMVERRDLRRLHEEVDRAYASIGEIALAAFLLSLGRVAPSAHPLLVVDTSVWRVANDQAVTRTGLARVLADDQKRLLNEILSDGRGSANRLVAVRLLNALGLTQQQATGMRKYEQVAGMASRREVEEKKLVTPDQLATMTRAYASEQRRLRAETLGQVEANRAHGRAELEAWVQATEQGLHDRGRITRTWNVTHFNTRDSHKAMDEQVRGLNQPFLSGLGNQLMHPGDGTAPPEDVVNCNCWVTYGLR